MDLPQWGLLGQVMFKDESKAGICRGLMICCGLPRWLSGEESVKIPWRRKWQSHSSILAWRIPLEEPRGL